MELNGQPMASGNHFDDGYCPTLEEIANECQSIQSTWTPDERMRRARGECGGNQSGLPRGRQAKGGAL